MTKSGRVVLDVAALNHIDAEIKTALEKAGEQIHTEVVQAQIVPRRDNILGGTNFFVDNSRAASGTVTLVHSTPYARRLYFHPEYNFHREPWTDEDGKTHEGNPNAQGLWLEPWKAGGEHADDFRKALEFFLGGKI